MQYYRRDLVIGIHVVLSIAIGRFSPETKHNNIGAKQGNKHEYVDRIC
ncbi:hypothetical protein GPLA_1142 [Paraglaciecola polaris LMG 21857]|uniref:Uncharacterized protein n=1 Tax=Paraglaciecola polaris LMG 21857 TaxID=1129793 RepID=K6ZP36_9ALTE|nr:hypothetical protein GPLA_1142 [Paraglaciecola polaris LMG 21857]